MSSHAILERMADSPALAWVLDNTAKLSTPASLAYAVGSLVRFVGHLPASVADDMTLVEAVVQIATLFFGSLSTVIGSSAVVLSVYMAGVWRRYRAETERIRAERDHEFRMAQLKSGEMDRKPCIAGESGSKVVNIAVEGDTEVVE